MERSLKMAYDEFNPVATFEGDIGGCISTSFVVFRDAKLHGNYRL